jgi:DNA helicase II / ATP-dependent DNA helicase PcrA
MMETEIYKGSRKEDKVMDLATILPRAFGIEDTDLQSNAAKLSAATNVFVACTRPARSSGLCRQEARSE